MRWTALIGGIAAVLVTTEAAAQQSAIPGWVDLVQPTSPIHQPQTEAEKKIGLERGRPLPAPELLQPSLDSALPNYLPSKAHLHGHFKAAASDVLAVLVKRWVAAFHKYQPGITVDVPPPYAGSTGAQELAKQELDFAFVSRELRPADITDFKARFGYPPLSVPTSGGSYRVFGALDAVGVIVNRDNPIDQLSFAQLDAILSTTHYRGASPIRTWGQLGLEGAWADKPIHVYAIKPWNGFEEFVRQRVLSTPGHRGEWRTDLNFVDVVFPVARDVATDPYALGYTGMAYLDAPVKVVALQAEPNGPAVSPTYDGVASAAYPLSRLTYFNVNKKPGEPLNPAIAEFLHFILSRQGQAIVRDQAIYMPLRGFQAEQSLSLLGR